MKIVYFLLSSELVFKYLYLLASCWCLGVHLIVVALISLCCCECIHIHKHYTHPVVVFGKQFARMRIATDQNILWKSQRAVEKMNRIL